MGKARTKSQKHKQREFDGQPQRKEPANEATTTASTFVAPPMTGRSEKLADPHPAELSIRAEFLKVFVLPLVVALVSGLARNEGYWHTWWIKWICLPILLLLASLTMVPLASSLVPRTRLKGFENWLGFPIFIVMLLLQFAAYALFPSPPFSVQAMSHMGTRSTNDTSWIWYVQGKTVSRVADAWIIRYTNLKSHPVQIGACWVETKQEGGSWVALPTFDQIGGSIYLGSPTNLTRALLATAPSAQLAELAHDRTFAPHEPVTFWLLSGHPPGGFGNEWRIRILESSGEVAVRTISPPPPGMSFQYAQFTLGTNNHLSQNDLHFR